MLTFKKEAIFLSLLLIHCALYSGHKNDISHEHHKKRLYTQYIKSTPYRWAERIIIAGLSYYFAAYNTKADFIQLLKAHQATHFTKSALLDYFMHSTPLPNS